jgi:hypothetical protein
MSLEWLQQPASGDHLVQAYRDDGFLVASVVEYAGVGLRHGEAVVVIATQAHRDSFTSALAAEGLDAAAAQGRGQLVILDAEATLARITAGGMPDWQAFHSEIGGLIARLRLEYPTVRAYGEMVDVLWQRGERDAALRLEEFWNDLTQLQTFSLLCAYRMDPLDSASFPALECICKAHTHLIPTADYERFNEAVVEASKSALDWPLSQLLLSLAERHRSKTAMPEGQSTLLWLQRNMPRTAEKVLAEVRARCPT